MTDSTDPKAGKGAEGASPEAKNPEPKEPKTVPVKAIAEAREKNRELKDEVEELKTELARLKEQQKQPEAAPKAEPDEAKAALEAIRQFNADQKRLRLASELGLSDEKQLEAVAAVAKEMPNLNPREALLVASLRDEKLFENRGQAGFDKTQHSSLRPTASGPLPQKQPITLKSLTEDARKLSETDFQKGNEAYNAIFGAAAAEASGLDHPLLRKLRQQQ